MKKRFYVLTFLVVAVFMIDGLGAAMAKTTAEKSKDETKVKACVIGGMTMTGLWQEVSKRFEAKTGIRVEVVATGPRPRISVPFRRGNADFLVMHSGDITTDLVVEGYGVNMRACARNELVILGPPEDPAGIKGMNDGAAAFKKIMDTRSSYLDGFGIGKREVCHKLWKKLHVKPIGDWVIKDESVKNKKMLLFASEHKAYMVFGRMPVKYGKVDTGTLKIMVEGDPAMQRPYVMMEANPDYFPHTNHKGSKMLSDFILSDEIQTFMKDFGKKESGLPWFYPVWPHNEKK